MTDKIDTIAIDGPAASGKSTIAIKLAKHYDRLFFDTGIMYRAVTLAAIEKGIDLQDENAVTQLAQQVQIDVAEASKEDGRTNDILVDGQDKTWDIRQPKVDTNVSVVAAYPGVRQALLEQQRRIGRRGKVIMVGRDIGTVVLPEAKTKIYLDASVEERARRRYQEAAKRGDAVEYEEVLTSLRRRDEKDTNRAVAPLRPAEDAVIVDSDGKDIDEIFAIIQAVIEKD